MGRSKSLLLLSLARKTFVVRFFYLLGFGYDLAEWKYKVIYHWLYWLGFIDLLIYKYLIKMTNGLGLVAYPIRFNVYDMGYGLGSISNISPQTMLCHMLGLQPSISLKKVRHIVFWFYCTFNFFSNCFNLCLCILRFFLVFLSFDWSVAFLVFFDILIKAFLKVLFLDHLIFAACY